MTDDEIIAVAGPGRIPLLIFPNDALFLRAQARFAWMTGDRETCNSRTLALGRRLSVRGVQVLVMEADKEILDQILA